MSIEQYSFAGYGYKISDREDMDYYWDFLTDEEQEAVFDDQHAFFHRLGEEFIFIGFKLKDNLAKDKFVEQIENAEKKFWANYISTLGDAFKPFGEPKVEFFTYWA